MKKGEVLKVLERHKMLTLVLERKVTQRDATRELGISLSHTKRLARRLKKAKGEIDCVLYQRTHPAPNRLPQEIRDEVVALRRENRGRSNPFIADPVYEQTGFHL
ncbi:MAG: hypothetical protein ACUVTR_02460 [Dehalococcoidia bacterium]